MRFSAYLIAFALVLKVRVALDKVRYGTSGS